MTPRANLYFSGAGLMAEWVGRELVRYFNKGSN